MAKNTVLGLVFIAVAVHAYISSDYRIVYGIYLAFIVFYLIGTYRVYRDVTDAINSTKPE